MKTLFSLLSQELKVLALPLALLFFVLAGSLALVQTARSWSVAYADTYTYTSTSTMSTSSTTSKTSLEATASSTSGSGGTGDGTGGGMVPAAPTGLVASVGACGTDSIHLTWQSVSDVHGYKVYRASTLIYTTTGHNYTDWGLTTATMYTYTVYAYNAYGSSAGTSITASVPAACTSTSTTTLSTSPVVPAAPSDFAVTVRSASYVQLSWKDNSTNESTFAIERKVSTSTSYALLHQTSTANVTSYTDTAVTPGSSYDYRVRACLTGVGCSSSAYLTGVLVPAPTTSVSTPTTYATTTNSVTGTTASLSPSEVSATTPPTTLTTAPTVVSTVAPQVVSPSTAPAASTDTATRVTSILTTLATTTSGQAATPKKLDTDLLYKDSNRDGISDYDSIHFYHLDPAKPSPISNYGGKVVTAAEKIVLGFDPTKKELVKMAVEEPASSTAPTVSGYTVTQVALTADNAVVITGQALPNSFVTVFIYSTPIMVTVKANARGEWHYTLDQELENGEHTVYVATINNTGNIVAKSPGYLFTRTAQAVGIAPTPAVPATGEQKPGLLGGNVLYLVIGLVFGGLLLGALMLMLAGMGRAKEPPVPPATPSNPP